MFTIVSLLRQVLFYFEEALMKGIIRTMLALLLIGSFPGFAPNLWALEKVNVTLPSKSFQFIIFPLAKERGYM